ncbi:MAG: hypothetical protein AB7P49_00710 [Bdellovibrionales bacterium]
MSKYLQRMDATTFASTVRSTAKTIRGQKTKQARSLTEKNVGSIRGRGRCRGRGRGRGGSQCRVGDVATQAQYQYDSENDGDDNIDTAEDDADGTNNTDQRRAQQIQIFRNEGVFRDLNPEDLEDILAMADSARVDEGSETSTGTMEDSSHPSSVMQTLFRLVMHGVVVPALNMNPFPYIESAEKTT